MYLSQLAELVNTLQNSLDPNTEVQVIVEAENGEVYKDGDILQVDAFSYNVQTDSAVIEASAEA